MQAGLLDVDREVSRLLVCQGDREVPPEQGRRLTGVLRHASLEYVSEAGNPGYEESPATIDELIANVAGVLISTDSMPGDRRKTCA